ncbi:hypothetical protein P4482_15730 [Neobacillus thermocopriae]|uniref:hypothetical protein n=1 Tax=Neobacillus thermocopriae TaxID=1215031 RepID=UPI002E1EBCDB|nr:hypothetical protein [Neobacillus thermocopriae]MED3715622.1 hypothetical protein [Neobacillus thermocopriae]
MKHRQVLGQFFLFPLLLPKRLERIHGRNVFVWKNSGSTEHWREVRFLYDYNNEDFIS